MGSLAQHLAKAFDAVTTEINLMEIKSLADRQSLLKTWMEQKTDKPKFLICNEANAGGETTAQRLLTPLFDLNKVVLILTSNATGPHLPFHSRFEDRIAAHLEFSMNDGLREKVMTREIEKLEVKFNVKCTWASKTKSTTTSNARKSR